MTPATKTEPMSKTARTRGPTNAPKAPASFQSPAPRLRRKTNGNSTSNPSPAPSREVLNPAHPLVRTFAETPTSNPGTVSQFGMRRLRQSVHPAISANATASPSTVGFKPSPICTGGAGSEPRCAKVVANAPLGLLTMRETNKLLPRAENAATTLVAADFHIARYGSQRGPQGAPRYRPLRAKGKGPECLRASRKSFSSSSYRLNAPVPLCSATIFFALSARALACGRRSRPFSISGSDSARTFMPSS
jgi:hypothetical protein